jgi:hypothetical protein
VGKPLKKSKSVKSHSVPIPKRLHLRDLRRDVLVKVRRAKQDAFLEFYGKYGTMALACHEVGIRAERISDWRHMDPVFDARVKAAEEMVGDRLVREVIHRATVGEEKAIRNKDGEIVDTIYEKSDSLLMFATKRHRPEYRDRVDIPILPIGGPTTNIQNNILLQVDPDKMNKEQLKAYVSLLESATPENPIAAGPAGPNAVSGPSSTPPARPS